MFDRVFVTIGTDRCSAKTMKQLAEGWYQVKAATPMDEHSWHAADQRFEAFPVDDMSAVAVAVNPSAIVISGVRACGNSASTNTLLTGVATPDMFRHVEAILQAALSAALSNDAC